MSSSFRGFLALAIEVLRSEGPRAVANRALDRLSDARRLRSLRHLTRGDLRLVTQHHPPPVLNVVSIPPSPKRGGSQIQMLDRLVQERSVRPVGLAYPKDGSVLLEVWTESESGSIALDARQGIAASVAEAARLIATDTVHVENNNGLPFGLIPDLGDRGLRTVLSVHDFSLFCRRPHLIESTTGRFCEYSTDDDRCRACLAHAEDAIKTSQTDHRRAAARILEQADAVVYPSEFLQVAHEKLFPETNHSAKSVVISPATSRILAPITRPANPPAIAFVGGCYEHKGGTLIGPVMERITAEIPGLPAFVYGNGDPRLTREVRRISRVWVRGYYRQGSLPSLLTRDRVTVAVLPSIWPEAYALVVDECLASHVPVVAFDLGAVGERLRAWGTGRLVPPNDGADGLAKAILEVLANPPDVSRAVIDHLPRPDEAARRHISLYQRMGPG